MDGSFRIGRIFGIPILIHYTFLLIIPLFAWIIGSQIVPTIQIISQIYGVEVDTTLLAAGYLPYLLGAAVALGLFAGVLIHELAHSLVARRNGIRINSITLLIFGGIASMDEGIPDPRSELPMALVGPVASLVVGLISSGLVYVTPRFIGDPAMAGVFIFLFGYLGLLNIILFAFNLLPAFPMDGGRVFRAWLAQRMPLPRATKIAADVGKGFAVIFAIIGILDLNPLLLLIAFFIYIGAGQETVAVKYSVLLRDIRVGTMMSKPVMTVEPTLPVTKVVELMYATKHLGFPVVEHNVLIGMVTVADVQKGSPIDRDAMQVRDVMSRDVIAVTPETPVTDVLRIMSVKDIGRVPVIENGALVGIVTRTDILKVVELRDI
ncbi:MAG TPA: CBS domain-containing protein [Methanoregulaceae archaeon]|nr:CBS domain-containing protein [Methanoregulaceae archaeon]HPD74502.1 CBS domain-containing protein [Methanoregulaceae archaeon]HRY75572.1 CBS domain-containing protein [Methanoregulaceae archaeon]